MLIICPKCSAKYCLPDEITLKNNQKLKCSMCQILFTADESATLDLTQQMLVSESSSNKIVNKGVTETRMVEEKSSIQSSPLSMWGESTDDNKTPINSEIGRLLSDKPIDIIGQRSATDKLPEVFMPVASDNIVPPKKRSLLLVLIYVFVIGGICFAGWSHRKALMPSFYDFMPHNVEQPNVIKKTVKAVNTSKIKKEKPNLKTQNDSKKIKAIASDMDVLDTSKKIRVVAQQDEIPLKTEESLNKSNNLRLQEDDIRGTKVMEPDIIVDTEKTEHNEIEHKTQIVPNVMPKVEVAPSVSEKTEPEAEEKTEQVASFDEAIDNAPLLDVVSEPIPVALEKELIIEDVHFNVTPNEQGVSQMLIEGTVTNTASEIRTVPVLTATIWDENNQVLERKKVHVAQDRLGPMETVSFYTSLVPAPIKAHHVDVIF